MVPEERVQMKLILNGQDVSIFVRPGRRLLDFLREDLGLAGTKEGCGEGECGSCTVILDGKGVLACLAPLEGANGHELQTIEGMGTASALHPLQKAFIEVGGAQCGFCIPGMIMAAVDLLNHNPNPTSEDIIVGIAGNLCRCTGYQKIIQAIDRAATEIKAA